MDSCPAERMPVLLFGAFDRHNFGDMLFAHVAQALLPGISLRHAGLADRDLRAQGGHRVHALSRLAAGERDALLIHVGGEILSCDAWRAAVMLLPDPGFQSVVARLDSSPDEKLRWAKSFLGSSALAPYSASRLKYPCLARVVYAGVGGVELGRCPAQLRREVLADLEAAQAIGVRDSLTRAQLEAAGLSARLIPDPVVMIDELFGARIRARSSRPALAAILKNFPEGYLAVQCSADFGDDRTLQAIATGLRRVAARTGLGVVLFRAGAAPWHDDLAVLGRLAGRMPGGGALFESLNIWDICALIAASRGYCGSSLHGRILASAFALPRLSLLHPASGARPGKLAAYLATWEIPGLPTTVTPEHLEPGLSAALEADPLRLAARATELAGLYRTGFAGLVAL
ncbi:polysaccharide pyruvyl transferase family protein [Niveibacterium terrae]|uniref:polysaccharide pyruvyl transferase family protein n=1 Tax=Niveibacterium terrae TaxID=3373598 RepID=UPI003A8EF14D